MPVTITRTRVILPHRRAEIVSRTRLLDLLFNLMDYKLVLIAAPAGYGKTSLLIDFANRSELPVAWYAIDSLDRDPYRFISHVIAAIAQQFPGFGTQTLTALDASVQSRLEFNTIINILVNEAYEKIREHYLLILDDFHLVNNQKEINYFISRLAQEIDENCHIIISSRSLLNLPDMPLMVARSMVGGISFEELSFQANEIQALIYQNYHLSISEKAAQELSQASEGWITGLLLSTQTRPDGLQDWNRLAKVSNVRLYDYLAEQVLFQQPQPVQNFLLQTACLEEFDFDLCSTLFGKNQDWSYLFDYVRQHNLFVLPVGDNSRWLRYHNLFGEFLQSRYASQNPADHQRILRKLALYHREREDWEKAHAILLRLEDSEKIADLIEEAGSKLIKNGRYQLIADWIDQLPVGLIVQHPNLISLRAVPEIVLGEIDRGLIRLHQAETALRQMNDTAGLAQTLARRATAYRFLGDFPNALQDSNEALSLCENNSALNSVKADALRARGICLYLTGEVESGIVKLRQALEIYHQEADEHNCALVHLDLGMAYMGTGYYSRSLNEYNSALDFWTRAKNAVRLANLLNNIGVLNHYLGDYEEAIRYFEKALVLAREHSYTRMQAYIYSSLGDLYADLDWTRSALSAYQRSRELAQKIDYHFLLVYTCLGQAACYRRLNQLDMAQVQINQAGDFIHNHSSRYESGLLQFETSKLLIAREQLTSALELLKQALGSFDASGQPLDSARVCFMISGVFWEMGDNEHALEYLLLTIKKSSRLESEHVLVISGLNFKSMLEKFGYLPEVGALYKKVIQFEAKIPKLRKTLRPRDATIPIIQPPKIVIQAFGKASLERDGKPVSVAEWQNQRRVREIFFYLIAHPSGKTKEQIGAIFWPDSSNAKLKLQFKNVIYKLRQALGPEVITFNNEVYAFNRDLDYEYDVERLNTLVCTAETVESIPEKIKLYLQALDLYKGPYLPEVGGSWVIVERQHFQRVFLNILLNLAELHFESSEFDAVIRFCERAIADDAFLEEAHRLAMRAYAAKGNRAGIIRHYNQCRLDLSAGMNTSPSHQTVSLYESLVK